MSGRAGRFMGLAVSMMAEERWRDILMAEESSSFVRAVKCVLTDASHVCLARVWVEHVSSTCPPGIVFSGASLPVCTVFCLNKPLSCAFVMPLA